MAQQHLDTLLRSAIAERRVITFSLGGMQRVAEPHDYGLIDDEPCLFFYQVGGRSRSGRPIGWRWAKPVSKITLLSVLDRHFNGARPAPTGEHVRWKRLYASVSRVLDEA